MSLPFPKSTVCRPIEGEPFRFHVRSRTDLKLWYLVDLECYSLNGWCACESFEFQKEPLLRGGAYPQAHLRCWHIEQARDYFLRGVMARMLEKFQSPAAKPPSRPPKAEPEPEKQNEPEPSQTRRTYQLDRSRKYQA